MKILDGIKFGYNILIEDILYFIKRCYIFIIFCLLIITLGSFYQYGFYMGREYTFNALKNNFINDVKEEITSKHDLTKIVEDKFIFPKNLQRRIVAKYYFILNKDQLQGMYDFDYIRGSEYIEYYTFSYKITDDINGVETFYKDDIKLLLVEYLTTPYVQFTLKKNFEKDIIDYKHIFKTDLPHFYKILIDKKIIENAIFTITPEMWYDIEEALQ